MTSKKLWVYAPTGSLIVGTALTLSAAAYINVDSWKRNEDGSLWYDNEGSTDIDWDSQQTRVNDKGEDLYVDENGDEWSASELVITDYDPKADVEDYVDEPTVVEMRLCEQRHTLLKPNVTYRFTVDPKCTNCLRCEKESQV